MSTTNRSANARTLTRWCVLLAGVLALTGLRPFSNAAAQSPHQRTFSSAEEAVETLVDTVKKGDLDGLIAIFGPDGKDLAASSDAATARMNRQVFTVAAAEGWRLTEGGAGRKVLVIGNEDWPFPVPLVKEANLWRFDTAAGQEEIIARRIGRNELAAIDTVRAYVAAQNRYASHPHDGNPPGVFATRFHSDAGKQNGLYWPARHGEPRSPLGDLVAQAAEEGRPVGPAGAESSPFHGYYFKILTGQSAAGPGGARSYILDGRMLGGFALVAWPAQYNVTGVMTFIVNQDAVVLEKDLGSGTDAVARKMRLYNPDPSWRPVQ